MESRVASRPNILWIVLDALRADRLGCYGYNKPTSPFMDSLAREGRRAEVAIAPGGYSFPSYTTMLSGLHPAEHGMHLSSDRVPPQMPLLQEVLQQRGYVTACIGGNPFFVDVFGLNRGFKRRVDHNSWAPLPTVQDDGQAVIQAPSSRWRRWSRFLGLVDYGGAYVTDATEEFITAQQNKPWFCFVHYMETHDPFAPPLSARMKCWRDLGRVLRGPLMARHIFRHDRLFAGGPQGWQYLNDLYDASARYSDMLVERLIKHLRKLGALDNTIIIVCADHGDFLGERGHLYHSAGLGEAVLRIPLILWGPDFMKTGTIGPGLIQLRDVPHTLCRLLNIDDLQYGAYSTMPYVDLIAESSVAGDRVAYVERPRWDFPEGSPIPGWTGFEGELNRSLRLVRDAEWEYLEYENGEQALYHVAKDAAETANLCDAECELAAHYRARMGEIRQGLSLQFEQTTNEDLTPDVQSRLRDLGYL